MAHRSLNSPCHFVYRRLLLAERHEVERDKLSRPTFELTRDGEFHCARDAEWDTSLLEESHVCELIVLGKT